MFAQNTWKKHCYAFIPSETVLKTSYNLKKYLIFCSLFSENLVFFTTDNFQKIHLINQERG